MANNNMVAQNKALELYLDCRDGTADEVSPETHTEKTIVKFIDQVNEKIEPLNLSIKLVTCEATNKKFFVLHAMHENDLTRLVAARQWGRNERSVLKTAIKTIVSSPNGRVSKAACAMSCADLPEKIKREDLTKVLQKLIHENWLIELNNQIYVGPRTLAEMKKYLSDEFEEKASACKLCKELTIRGSSCPSSCGVKLHQDCLQAFFSKAKNRKCMGCKKPWPEELVDKQDALSDTEETEY
ncbi:Hypothetical predicted protein [Cloeon dipterum]|uniref:Non-structural maintenance of chromosomes element 1 homolog n=1 Tax=Cloeon dipterum TaxID=197152 RepID=A0A8S1C001_9INSE|nr:Hypothetical predicted protein [Cloeon dipterum]